MEKAFQKEEKAVSMGTEAGMSKSQVRKGKLPGMVHRALEGEKWEKILKGLDCQIMEFGLTL